MAKTQHFTQKGLEILLPEEKPYLVRDDEVKGLVVKVYPSGNKTFFLDVLVDRKHDMFKIGVWPDLNVAQVREKAKKMRADLAQGKNPKAEKKEGITLGEFFPVYMERHGSEKKSASKDRSHFERLLKSWQNYRLVDITRTKVESLHKTLGKETPVQANRVLALLSTLFSKAIIWGYHKGENPCRGVKKFREVSRDRFLSGEELARFFEALDLTENPAFKDFILLSLFTGARKSNVLSMRWKDIDFERNVWKIPGELSKNGDPMQVPLGSDVLEILKRRRAETSSVFVLPGPGEKGHYMEPKRAWGTLLKRAKLEDLRIHDLRRSMGSWMTIGGTSLPIVGKALEHKTSKATSIYARLNLDPVRAAMVQAVEAMNRNRKKATV
ncbi:MAG: site-specific integrase [Nitrospirae bacterium]|nr:site-specific integrase [Nitrospirota bacterium]